METLWDAARIGQLTALHQEGLSYRLIANEIGLSKNAVIGKARRMHLAARIQIVACDRNGTDKAGTVDEQSETSETQRVDSVDSGCSILDLTDWTCRYPLWTLESRTGERFYCGHPTACLSEGRPYCPLHAEKCHSSR